MAVLRERRPGVPDELAQFNPERSGSTVEGVRAWRRAACAWLEANPDRGFPFGEHGDPVDVYREAIRLIAAL